MNRVKIKERKPVTSAHLNIGPGNSVQCYYWISRPIYLSIFNKNCLFGTRSRYRHDLNLVFVLKYLIGYKLYLPIYLSFVDII